MKNLVIENNVQFDKVSYQEESLSFIIEELEVIYYNEYGTDDIKMLSTLEYLRGLECKTNNARAVYQEKLFRQAMAPVVLSTRPKTVVQKDLVPQDCPRPGDDDLPF